MNIKWLGHSCFLLTANSGKKILIDPFDGEISIPKTEADIVITSHNHWDHNAVNRAVNIKAHINQSGEYKYEDILFEEIPTFHDNFYGAKRGNNLVSVINIEGLRICHFGDLGENFSDNLVEKIGKIDIALICVGGTYTIDYITAHKFISALKPKITIPMHYRYKDWFSEVDSVDKFVSLWHNKLVFIPNNFIDLKVETLPEEDTLIVFKQ
ncbi:MAG TPA: MBL fold metallo-hydrolase [Clostridia bacterium]|nr:MBL fold metallo-hydrolase [Clostridia bacterium]